MPAAVNGTQRKLPRETWDVATRVALAGINSDPADPQNARRFISCLSDEALVPDGELSAFLLWFLDVHGNQLSLGDPVEIVELAIRRNRVIRAGERETTRKEAVAIETANRLARLNPTDPQFLEHIDQIAAAYRHTLHTGASRPFGFAQVSDMPLKPPSWLVKYLIERDSFGIIFGDPGSAKTFVALDVGLAVSTGRDFHGRGVAKGTVFYLCGEGREGISRRAAAWRIRNRVDLSDSPFFVSERPASLTDAASIDSLTSATDELAAIHGRPALVIFDTMSRNFGPGSENDSRDMAIAIRSADLIRNRYGCTVLFVHHSGHGDKSRSRGHSSLFGAADFEFRVEKDRNSGVVRMECTKSKDVSTPEPLAFQLREVDLGLTDEDGKEVTSCVLDPVEYDPTAASEWRPTGKWQRLAIELLREQMERQRANLESAGLDPETARVKLSDWQKMCHSNGMDSKRFSQMRKALDENEVVNVEFGYVSPGRSFSVFRVSYRHNGRNGIEEKRQAEETEEADEKRTQERNGSIAPSDDQPFVLKAETEDSSKA